MKHSDDVKAKVRQAMAIASGCDVEEINDQTALRRIGLCGENGQRRLIDALDRVFDIDMTVAGLEKCATTSEVEALVVRQYLSVVSQRAA